MIRRSDPVYDTTTGILSQRLSCTLCDWTAETEVGDWGLAECHVVDHAETSERDDSDVVTVILTITASSRH